MTIKLSNLVEGSSVDKFTKLHNDLLKYFKKMKNTQKVSDYGPEENKWNPHVYDSEIVARSKDVNIGNRTSATFFRINLHYDTKQDKTNLFVPDKATLYFKGVPSIKNIIDALNKETDLKSF